MKFYQWCQKEKSIQITFLQVKQVTYIQIYNRIKSKVQVMINGGTDMVENMIGKKVFLIDDLGDGEMLMCSDTVTAVLLEENSMSVRCKTSGNEFWTVGKNAFFSECEAKQAFKMRWA